jgi:hypothetical protein
VCFVELGLFDLLVEMEGPMNCMGGILGVFSLAGLLVLSAADIATAGKGGSSSDSDNPPTPPTFTGGMVKDQPCQFSIGLSSTDEDDDLSSFGKTCKTGTWTSNWFAYDRSGNESGTSGLTLTCNSRGSNSHPSAPTFSRTLDQAEPCKFSVSLSSTDPHGYPVSFEMTSPESCLPPGHDFNGSAITGQTATGACQWTCAFVAVNDHCEKSETSSVTLRCHSSAGCNEALPIDAYCACCSAEIGSRVRGSAPIPAGCENYFQRCQ